MSSEKIERIVGVIGSIVMFLLVTDTFAQGNWYATGYLQYSQGDYIFGTNTGTFYLVPGVRYETGGWNISAILPVVSQNNNLVTGAGGMLVPHGGTGMNGSSVRGGMMGGGMTTMDSSMSDIVGLGDLYLSGEYDFIHPDYDNVSPTVGINLQVKVPTASTTHNFGTGKIDYGGTLNYRQMFGTFVIMADVGYLILGNPAGVDFRNPFTYSGGVGQFFDNGDLSLALLYQGYTVVLSGYAPPNQVSAGLNYKLSSDVIGTVLFSKGLTNTSPNISATAGFRWKL